MGSGDLDIQPFIREKSDRNCAVAWFAGDFPLSTWQPTENELCPVPTGKLQQFEGFVWNEFEEFWVATKGSNLRPGQILVLPTSAGGYNAITGWTGDPTDKPTLLERTGIRDHYSDDRSTQSYMPVSLAQHSLDVRQEMQQLMNELSFELPEELLDIAQWHDLGKAHWVFQSALGSPEPIGAKGKFKKRYERCGFRHELASALARDETHNKPFYFAYLVAAHHGKVRGTITPLSYEETTYRVSSQGKVFQRWI
ncbi:MAG: CRISPR-associated endonuclease Cas3'' [Leptolyngbya foveolarum]|uniref:CRISPR-associated endonuclease Cas3 n=1 Tax=Leptolyngbya foveolarum TaxID=47253 RepID=A0A2W4U4F2_9CYAN|nr:MAG: CRISPR-associated endonuclease Cas3'' [Leptolyngbya foveolarum]